MVEEQQFRRGKAVLRMLLNGLRAPLEEWNPLGADSDWPAHEYDDFAVGPLLRKLRTDPNEVELASWLGDQTREHFGLGADVHADRRAAGAILAWWRANRNRIPSGVVADRDPDNGLAGPENSRQRFADLVVTTERLGWPPRPRGWRRFVPWEFQGQMVYDDRPEEPTATCHLQPSRRENALCGYPWEGLIAVPGAPPWSGVSPELRCDDCERHAGT